MKKIFLTIFTFILFIFLPTNETLLSTTRDFSVNLEVNNSQWIRLPAEIDTIHLQFLNGQKEAFLETNSEKKIFKMTEDLGDGFHNFEKGNEKKGSFSQILDIKNSQRIKISSSGAVKIFGWKKNLIPKENFFDNFVAGINNFTRGIKIISRKEWGADESLRFNYSEDAKPKKTQYNVTRYYSTCENSGLKSDEKTYAKIIYNEFGKPLLWPHQYSKDIKKIIIHHTAESYKSQFLPGKQKMRGIYRYHTLTKRWGDIGYHYIIDQKGNIYEGKSGGDYVVGAHAKCYNIGSLGISMMGNFQNQKPTLAQLRSLSKLIAYLGAKYNLDVTKSSYFHGVYSQNILGHRDVGKTACPGDNLYKKIPSIRKQIELSDFNFDIKETTNFSSYENIAEIKTDISVLEMQPTTEKQITFTYKNTSNKTWTKGTWLYVADNTNRNLYVESIFPDKNYVAANLEEDKVYPGGIGHFKVTIVSGYESGLYSLEFVPIINGTTKFTKGTIVQPVKVKGASNSYQFVQLKQPPREIYGGQSFYAKIILQNTGNTKWFRSGDHAIKLKTFQMGRRSPFVIKEEGSNDTILARLKEKTVEPGEFGTFEFFLRAPMIAGEYQEKFIPVIGEDTFLGDRSMQFNIKVKKPHYRAQLLRKSRENVFLTGQKKTVKIGLKNLSDVAWESEQVSFHVVRSGGLKFDSFVYPIIDFVPRHQAGFADVTIQAPTKPGTYTATLQALANGKNFDRLGRFELKIEVKEANLSGIITHLSAKKLFLKKGTEGTVIVRIKNKTNITWYKNGKNRISLRTTNSNSKLYSKSWIDKNIVALMKENKVSPGKTATFIFKVKANQNGTFTEKFFTRVNSIGTIKGTEFETTVVSGEKIKAKKEPKLYFESGLSIAEKIRLMREKIANEKKSKIQKEKSIENEKILEKTKKTSFLENEENNIKIKLSFPHNAVNFGIKSENFGPINGEIFLDRKKFFITEKNNIWVRSDGNKKIIVSIDGKKYWGKYFSIKADNGFVFLKNWIHSPAWNKKINDNFFRGKIEVYALDNRVKGKILVINNLDIEDYMKGIAEVPESSNHEKRKALTVVARSYASFYTKTKYRKFPGKNYDGSDDPDVFQKYLGAGYEKRSPKWQQALRETKGEILRFNGEILKTAFFSCSNGKTKTPAQAGWKGEYFNKVSSVYQSVNDKHGKDTRRYRLRLCGHGVGLSGLGAEKFGQMGWSYRKILHYYYQGVDIGKLH
ncbi:N-acetylmuramoyl-L-alanine amidase [Candidatus Gracilibacteria bacterium]|nr:N-acetylmuramoyl-L-alanine amidase [Candidatus Gracilibacteria bacterium]